MQLETNATPETSVKKAVGTTLRQSLNTVAVIAETTTLLAMYARNEAKALLLEQATEFEATLPTK